ncbi:hypothetical protein H476_0621 [[Clostridium] sordellii VPI 9048]|nr:hypothetical protein H476_0621 [[Clostridium] sordellii VPI 9048] [Paeniclostridium sordellii VPI 9048]
MIIYKLVNNNIHLKNCINVLIFTIPGFKKNIVKAIIIDFMEFIFDFVA